MTLAVVGAGSGAEIFDEQQDGVGEEGVRRSGGASVVEGELGMVVTQQALGVVEGFEERRERGGERRGGGDHGRSPVG